VSLYRKVRYAHFLAGVILLRPSDDVGLIVGIGKNSEIQELDIHNGVSAGVNWSHDMLCKTENVGREDVNGLGRTNGFICWLNLPSTNQDDRWIRYV